MLHLKASVVQWLCHCSVVTRVGGSFSPVPVPVPVHAQICFSSPLHTGAVSSLASNGNLEPNHLGLTSARAIGSNREINNLCKYTHSLTYNAFHPFGSVNWCRQFVGVTIFYAVIGGACEQRPLRCRGESQCLGILRHLRAKLRGV